MKSPAFPRTNTTQVPGMSLVVAFTRVYIYEKIKNA